MLGVERRTRSRNQGTDFGAVDTGRPARAPLSPGEVKQGEQEESREEPSKLNDEDPMDWGHNGSDIGSEDEAGDRKQAADLQFGNPHDDNPEGNEENAEGEVNQAVRKKAIKIQSKKMPVMMALVMNP